MKQYTTETQKPNTDKKDTRHDNAMLVLLQLQVIYFPILDLWWKC